MLRMLVSFRFLTRWFGEHPIAGFLLLTFGISYLIGFPALITYTAWAPPQPRVLRTYASRVLVVYGPGLAAILLSLLAQGRPGATDLVRRLVPRRRDLPWAVWIVLAGAVSSGLALARAGVSFGELVGAIRSAGLLLLTHCVLQILIVSIGEELGWRGWLLPRLLERFTRLRATLLTAAAWGLWHGPLLLSPQDHRALPVRGSWVVVSIHLDLGPYRSTPLSCGARSRDSERADVLLGRRRCARLAYGRHALGLVCARGHVCLGGVWSRAGDSDVVGAAPDPSPHAITPRAA